MNNKLLLFDCDETLWNSQDKDYVSSVNSHFEKITFGIVERKKDGKKFVLRPGVKKAFDLISKKGFVIGIVSDNKKPPVVEVMKLFNVWSYINHEAINIKLWNGYCPKHKMILDVLSGLDFYKAYRDRVYWFDDKDYTSDAKEIGVNFIKVDDGADFVRLVKDVVGC